MKELPDYNKALRAIGYVDSGLSGNRGFYFIISYRPSAKKKHNLLPGLVEVHIFGDLFEIHTRYGVFKGADALEQAIHTLSQKETA